MKNILGINVKAEYQLRLHDAKTGKIVRVMPRVKNLIGDVGLNGLAGQFSFQAEQVTRNCAVGSSSQSVSTNSGAITFSQSGTSTVTASAGFFTSNMVGAILKYGTGSGGQEQYIQSFTNSTTVTVATSAAGFPTISGTVGTVWNVQATNLVSFLYNSSTYATSTGSNGTTYTGSSIAYQRTYVFPVQSSSYTVNEVGWGATTISSGNNGTLGRAVVSSTVVGTTNFLTVVITLTLNYSPASPTAVSNVNTVTGGGALSTAGNAMIEGFSIGVVNTDGTDTQATPPGTVLCNGITHMFLLTGSYTQQTSIFSGAYPFSMPISVNGAYRLDASWAWQTQTSQTGGTVAAGTTQISYSSSLSTAGETVTGIGLSTGLSGSVPICFDIKLTTPFTLPTGPFPVSATFTLIYSRTLVN